jgi:hypothetical protein
VTQKSPLPNFEKPTIDLDSPPLITVDQTLWNVVLFSKTASLDPKTPLPNFEGAGRDKWKDDQE